ncbi:MAG: thioredoxin family protein [Muribaculaceae bacterium]|nr:thioredoxin family protein [Muribaculaceae bacterium]
MDSFQETIGSKRLVLVDFFAVWCKPCRKMRTVLERLQAEEGIDIHIHDVDVDRGRRIALANKVQSIPTYILFKDGEPAWRHSGEVPLDDLVDVIQKFK